MEERPPGSELDEYSRPHIELNFAGPEGRLSHVLTVARQHLTGHALQSFDATMWQALTPSSSKTYEDILEIVSMYMDVLDTSDTYPQYSRGRYIMSAIDRLNNHLHLLPPGADSFLTGLYPELDNPDMGADKYGILLDEEFQRVEGELAHCPAETRDGWLELRTELLRCRSALQRAGIAW